MREQLLILIDPLVSAVIILFIGLFISIYLFRTNRRALINYVPHVWTALGVLGTFAVLFVTLTWTNISFSAGDINETIKKLTSAFSTSIVGIIGSIISAIVSKNRLHKIDLAEAAEKPYLLQDPRELLHAIQRSQEQKLEEIKNETIATAAAVTKIEYAINEKLSTAIGDFQKVLSGILSNLSQEAIEESRTQVSAIYEKLTEYIETLLSSQNLLIQSQTEKMDRGYEAMKNVLQKRSGEILEVADQTKETLTSGMDELSGHYQTEAKKIIEEFGKVAESVNAIGGDLKTALDRALRDRLTEMNEIFDNIGNWQRENKETMESVVANFSKSVTEYQSVQGSNQEILGLVKNQTGALQEFQKKLEKLTDSIKDYDFQMEILERRVSEMVNLMERLERVESKIRMNGNGTGV